MRIWIDAQTSRDSDVWISTNYAVSAICGEFDPANAANIARLPVGQFGESRWSHFRKGNLDSALGNANDVLGRRGATFAGSLGRCDEVANSFDQFICRVRRDGILNLDLVLSREAYKSLELYHAASGNNLNDSD
jgi:hypothetical protein